MNIRHVLHRAVPSTLPLLASLMFGCAGPEDALDEPAAADSLETRTEAFTESNCGSAPADYTLVTPPFWGWQASPDAAYNHSQCTNSYVVAIDSTNTNMRAFAAYNGPVVPPSWGCNGMWVNVMLWKQGSGGTYTKVGSTVSANGVQDPLNSGACIAPSAGIWIPSSGAYKVIAQAGYATGFQPLIAGFKPAQARDMSNGDSRGYTADGDWASTLYKGECAVGDSISGISRIPSGGKVRNVLCDSGASYPQGVYPSGGTTTLNFTSGDDMRNPNQADWDWGFTKGLCPVNMIMTGLAQTSAGVVNKARCAPVTSGYVSSACTAHFFNSGDSRSPRWEGDWSIGDYKGECNGSAVVVGVSKDSAGKIRSILCCELPHL